jgi:hypothetical protein
MKTWVRERNWGSRRRKPRKRRRETSSRWVAKMLVSCR